MKRLAIYFFYDKDGVVDDYVPYFLNALKPFCEELCVVVNGKLLPKGRELLEQNVDTVLIRENVGFDSWAYKHAIEYYGYEKLKNYDELILCNFTFFGPIYPLSELFDKMAKTVCHFWGIHRHPALEAKVAETPIIEHIQSHFIVFRKDILQSPHFSAYWHTLQPVNSYDEAIARHELRCTNYFEKQGFKSACYVEAEKYLKYKVNASIHYAYKQTVEDRCPILKRKFLWINNHTVEWAQFTEESALDLINYLETNTDYDINLIWKNLCRTQEVQSLKVRRKDIVRFFKYKVLRWILPWNFKKYKTKQISLKNTRLISYEDLKRVFEK